MTQPARYTTLAGADRPWPAAAEAATIDRVGGPLPGWCAPAFVVVSLMDLTLTWVILNVHFGREANPVARLVLETFGFHGLALYKAAIVLLVLLVCRELAGRSLRAGRRMSYAAISLSAIPVLWSLHLLGSIWFSVWLGG